MSQKPTKNTEALKVQLSRWTRTTSEAGRQRPLRRIQRSRGGSSRGHEDRSRSRSRSRRGNGVNRRRSRGPVGQRTRGWRLRQQKCRLKAINRDSNWGITTQNDEGLVRARHDGEGSLVWRGQRTAHRVHPEKNMCCRHQARVNSGRRDTVMDDGHGG